MEAVLALPDEEELSADPDDSELLSEDGVGALATMGALHFGGHAQCGFFGDFLGLEHEVSGHERF